MNVTKDKKIVFILIFLALLLFVSLFVVLLRKNLFDTNLPATQEVSLAQAQELILIQKYPEALSALKTSLKEAKTPREKGTIKYNIAFVYSSIALKDPNDQKSFKKSVALTKKIQGNELYPKILKARSIEIIDRFLVNGAGTKMQSYIMKDKYYKTFATTPEKNLYSFRKNMLEYAASLYPLAGVEMRLATLYAQDVAVLQKEPENETRKVKIEQARRMFFVSVAQGDASLKENYTGAGAANTPEVLLNKAIAAQYFFEATGETPFGEVGKLYQDALAASDQYFKPVRAYIEKYYSPQDNKVLKTFNQ